MITISLCMIVKDEEDVLDRCLNSISNLVDEIIIVDTGSTDSTKEIAKNYTDKIYDFKWINDFSAARNFSFSKANMEYILWLDADDVLLLEDRMKFKKLISDIDPSIDTLMMNYNYAFDADGIANFSCLRERLIKKSINPIWNEPVHEYINLNGKVDISNINITHGRVKDTVGRNISIYDNIIAEGKILTPRGMYYYARELKDNGRHITAIKYFNLFLSTGKGWIEDNIASCNELAKSYIAIGERKKGYKTMLRSFEYAPPRAEICCQIGYYHKDTGDYAQAIFWFELALSLKKPEGNMGFIYRDCWGYIPNIELAVCYDISGNVTKAIEHNDLALSFKPDDEPGLQNKKYFNAIMRGAN